MTIYHLGALLLELAAIGLGVVRCVQGTTKQKHLYRLTVRVALDMPLANEFGVEMLVNLEVPAESEEAARRQVVNEAMEGGYSVSAFHACELITE